MRIIDWSSDVCSSDLVHTWSTRLRTSSASPVAACCPKRSWRQWMAAAIRPRSCALPRGQRRESPGQDLALMAGTVRRGGQIAWAGLKLGVVVLRLRRREPDRLPAYVSATLGGRGTTLGKLGQGLSLRWDLLPAHYRDALADRKSTRLNSSH